MEVQLSSVEANMDVETYFDFLDPLDIRFKDHRIGIDDVLYYYLKGDQPRAIQERYPTLTIEQVEAAIAYYHRNRPAMDRYLEAHAQWAEQRRAVLEADPPPVALRIREQLQASREG